MRVTLMRHLPTKHNLECIFIGQEDLECDYDYIKEHTQEIIDIKSELDNFDELYCSPLKRAVTSAQLITRKQEIRIDNRLIERDLGEWSNMPKELMRKAFPEAFYSNGRLKFTFTPKGGESFTHLIMRTTSFLIDMYRLHKNDTIGVMTHNGVITTVKCLMAQDLQNSSQHGFQPYLQPFIIDFNAEAIEYLLFVYKTIIEGTFDFNIESYKPMPD